MYKRQDRANGRRGIVVDDGRGAGFPTNSQAEVLARFADGIVDRWNSDGKAGDASRYGDLASSGVIGHAVAETLVGERCVVVATRYGRARVQGQAEGGRRAAGIGQVDGEDGVVVHPLGRLRYRPQH